MAGVGRYLAAATVAVLTLAPLTAQSPAPFTAWDMIRVEDVGEGRLSPDGSILVYERHLPASDDFGPGGVARSRLFVAHRANAWSSAPLLASVAGSRYLLGHFSPDGQWVSFRRRAAGTHVWGAVHPASGRVVEFAPNVDYNAYQYPWVSSTLMVGRMLPPGQLPLGVERFEERLTTMAEAWKQGRAGVTPTASVLGTGRYSDLDDRYGDAPTLVLLDVSTGQARSLASGRFDRIRVSPDQRWISAIEEAVAVTGGERLDRSAGVSRTLIVFDVQTGARVTPCPGRNVMPFAAAEWSPDGTTLTVPSLRAAARSDDDVTFWHVDTTDWSCRPAVPEMFTAVRGPTRNSGSVNLPRSAWLGDEFVVLGYPASAGADRRGWYAMARKNPAAPRLLTGAFGQEPVDVVGVTSTRLVAVAGGDAWTIAADGTRTALTDDVTDPVRLWMDDITPGYPPLPPVVAPQIDVLPLETRPGDTSAVRRVFQIALATRVPTAMLEVPNISKILSAHPAQGVVAYKSDVDGVRELTIVERSRDVVSSRTLLSLNEHLRHVARSRVIPVPHKGGNGESLTSFLRVPAAVPAGRKLPMIVSIYPGTVHRSVRPSSLTAMQGDHPELWTSYGYAVLEASIPMSTEVPRDIGDGLAAKVLAAVDAAIATGMVDSDRLALQGHSFGGWGTLMTISQTRRFKAAAASSAPVNWTSMYGAFDPVNRMTASHVGDVEVRQSEAESRQGGMGAPPWVDAERYLRNSPLMHVASIETPVMLIQGDLDYVPIGEGEQMYSALRRAGKDSMFVRYWGEWHGVASPANIRDIFSRKLAWYDDLLDVARTPQGDVEWTGAAAASRGGRPAHSHAWYLDIDRMRSMGGR